jgi:hypothetical protein
MLDKIRSFQEKHKKELDQKVTDSTEFDDKNKKRIAKVLKNAGVKDSEVLLVGSSWWGQIIVTNDAVLIGREGGITKVLEGFTKGSKKIPYTSITAVQYKVPGVTAGYIQLTVPGAIENVRGVLDANHDENTIIFNSKEEPVFFEIKQLIEKKIAESKRPTTITQTSNAEELIKFHGLLEKGIITQEEFNSIKSKLI